MTQQNNEQPSKKTTVKKKKRTYKHLGARILAVFLVMVITVGVIGVTVIWGYASDVDTSQYTSSSFDNQSTSKMYDNAGNEFFDMGYKLRENITYEDLPQSLIDAFVAVEDSRYFEHNGFDIPRFSKAAIENVFHSLKEGGLSFDGGGGSTFTMQLVKNKIFVVDDPETGEVSEAASEGMNGIERKIKEIYIATYVENSNLMSKKEIFASYLNLINFGAGNNIMGVQNSSLAYFGKSVSELNLLESAFLAGVINAPSVNNPYHSIENAQDRTIEVLYQMLNHGYITEEEYNLAVSVPIENLFINGSSEKLKYPYQAYIDAVLEEVSEFTEEFYGQALNPYTTEMRIYTGMDETIQKGLDSISNREISELDHGAASNIQIATSVNQNKTGLIVGLLGGYDYDGARLFNRATSGAHSPGSTIKPLLEYTLAFEYLGYSTSHVLTDEPTKWSWGTEFTNYDNTYKGQLSIMDAVADSRNTNAVQTMQAVTKAVGEDVVVDYMTKLGIPVYDRSEGADHTPFYDEQAAIGSGEFFAVDMVDLAAAYSAIYNAGEYIKPHTITKIELVKSGKVIEANYTPVEVVSDEAAYLTTRLMNYTASNGGVYTAVTNRSGYEVYSKTGSVGWDSSGIQYGVPNYNTRDKLMVSGTSEFSIATWTGFDEYTVKNKPWFSDEEYAMNVTGKTNSYILDLLEEVYGTPANVSRPSGVVDITHILGTFPYQSPLADMNKEMVKTGLVRSKFATLANPVPQELKELSKQTVEFTQNGEAVTVNISLTPYPDADKLKVADSTLPTGGRRLYDDSWIYGAVQYKTEIRANNNIIKDVVGSSEKQTITFNVQDGVTKYQVCSYYTYDKSTVKSNDVCQDITVKDAGDEMVSVPNFVGKDYTEFRNWASSNNLTEINKEYVYGELNKFNTIQSISPKAGVSIKMRDLSNTTFNVSVYDYSVNANQFGNVNDLIQALSSYNIKINNPGGGTVITSFTINGVEYNSFNLSDMIGSEIIVNTN